MRWFILLVAITTACAVPLGEPVSAPATTAPSPSASAAARPPSPSAASTTVASPTAFPSVSRPTGFDSAVYTVGPSGVGDKVFACPSPAGATLAERSPDAMRLLVLCFDGGDAVQGYVLEAGGARQEIPALLFGRSATWSPDSRGVALFALGTCMTISCGRIIYYDVASRAVSILLSDDIGAPPVIPPGPDFVMPMDSLRWTTCGLTYFRGGTPGGTFLLEGNSWRRIGSDRIDASPVNSLC